MNQYSVESDEITEKTVASKRDVIALVAVLLLLTFSFWILIDYSIALGFAVIWFISVGASWIYLRDAAQKQNSVITWMFGCASVIFTPLYVLSNSAGLSLLTFAVQTVGWLCWIASYTGRMTGTRRLSDLLSTLTMIPGAMFYGMFDLGDGLVEYKKVRGKEKEENQNRKKPFPWSIVGGAALAFPVLLVLIFILASADEAFNQMVSEVFNQAVDFISDLGGRLGSFFGALVLALLFFFPITGIMYRFRKVNQTRKPIANELFSGALMLGFYGSIALLCVAYLFSQLSYLFNGFLGILPGGMTAAEYARRGFFEILIFSLITLGLIAMGLLWGKQDRLSHVIKGLLVFLSAFNLVLIATASAKMILYMSLYGLTLKRLTVSAILLFMAVLFVVLILGRFIKKLPSLPIVLGAAILIFAAIGYANPSRLVANYNVAAWESGKLETIDLEHLRELEDSAVDALIKVAESSDEALSKEATSILTDIFTEKQDYSIEARPLETNRGFFGYNYAEASANRQLNEFFGFSE